MPAPVLPNNTLRVKFFYRTKNRTCTFDLYYEVGVPSSINNQNQIEKAADAIYTFFAEEFTGVMSDSFFFDGIMCYFKAADDVLWEGAKMSPSAGTFETTGSETQTLPDECAVVIRKLTGRQGPEDRGRLFLSTVSEAQQTYGTLVPAAATAYQNFANKLPQTIIIDAAAGPPATEAMVIDARHWNRKANVLRPITAARAVGVLASRRDRRKPLIALPVT